MVQVQDIVDVIAEVVPDGGTVLARRAPQALAPAQAMTAALAPRLEADPTYAPLWQVFQTAPKANKPILVGMVQVLVWCKRMPDWRGNWMNCCSRTVRRSLPE